MTGAGLLPKPYIGHSLIAANSAYQVDKVESMCDLASIQGKPGFSPPAPAIPPTIADISPLSESRPDSALVEVPSEYIKQERAAGRCKDDHGEDLSDEDCQAGFWPPEATTHPSTAATGGVAQAPSPWMLVHQANKLQEALGYPVQLPPTPTKRQVPIVMVDTPLSALANPGPFTENFAALKDLRAWQKKQRAMDREKTDQPKDATGMAASMNLAR